MSQQVIMGRGSLNQANLTGLMAALSIRRPLLVCSERMARDFTRRTGLTLPIFSGYHPNPDLADCVAGADMYRALNCDGLISVGGGSAMDTAKAVKALLITGDMDAVKAARLPEDARLPHIAIPGTAGTGSEATQYAVVYVNNEKLSVAHNALLPEGVILDSALLDTLPVYHKKACALDALCQGIESWWAAAATQESRIHAARCIRLTVENLNAYLDGDQQAAENILLAAYESGLAIRISRTTAAHAMSYQITKRIGPAHGHACMLTLPHLWRRMPYTPALAELDKVLNIAPGEGPDLMLALLAATEMLPDAQIDDVLLDALTASVDVTRLDNHPDKLDAADVRALYAQAFAPIPDEEKARLAARWRNYAG